MTWILIFALIAWSLYLARQLGGVKSRLATLERRLAELRHQAGEAPAAARAAPSPAPIVDRPAPAPPRPAAAARVAGEPMVTPRESPPPEAFQLRPPRPEGPPLRDTARAWLEENGLAWAGGAALTLGGLFLVSYAAQRGVFTPALRIVAAIVTGFVMLAASEWLRRRAEADAGGHRLAAAATAGAGAATLYGAVWASYWLYAFIGLGAAGGLLGVVSLGLLVLAFRHGEPLAVLAITGGFLAPVITGPEQWAAPALTAYLSLITVTGYAVAGQRRWGWAGLTTLAGAALWGVAGFTAEGYGRVAALAVAPVALSYAALEWRRRKGETVGTAGRGDSFDLLAPAAVGAGAVLVGLLWFRMDLGEAPAASGLGAIGLAVLAAYGVRRGLIVPPLQALAYAAGAGAIVLALEVDGAGAAAQLWAAAVALVLALAGVAAGPGRNRADGLWASAAAVVALLIVIPLNGPYAGGGWIPEAAASLVLLAAAAAVARRSDAPARDLPLAVWIWTAGAAALIALQQALDARVLPMAAAALSLTAAALHARLGWRGFGAVMLAGALASLAALISPPLFEALHEGELRWFAFAAVAAVSAALVYAGSWVARRADRPRESAEALETGALIIGLTGLFILLRLWSTAGAVGGGIMDPFLEASLRTLLLLVAGLTSAQAVRADSSVIGRWRGQALLLLGLAHGVVVQALVLNPLWAWWKPAVAGPPLADTLFVGFLVPAALLGVATVRKVSIRRGLLAVYAAGAALFALLWALMETRRLFQGASLHAALDGIGRAEAAAYALVVLLFARAVLWLGEAAAKRDWTFSPLARQVGVAGCCAAWAAVALSLWVFGYAASPWWGPIDRPLAGHGAVALLFALYAAGALATLWLAPPAPRLGDPLLGRAARLGATAVVFALTNLVVRWGFRGLDMRPDLREASLETWTFSAVWGLYGFGLLVYGAARRSSDLRMAGLAVLMITLAKIFLFDMARLDGVVRAASFLAVGALLVTAAVLVRRLSGGGLSFAPGRARSQGAPDAAEA
jgi:uncharacterized membrane protein